MDEQRIWAPWRMAYVAHADRLQEPSPAPTAWRQDADQGCFLCRAAATFQDASSARQENLVVATGQHTIGLLNRYPYTNGHLLIAPLRHAGELSDLTDEEHLEAMHVLARFTQTLRELVSADGFNVGLNLGMAAGAGVPGHLHWHLVPRWQGDHNFMPTLAGVRVIPQSLSAMWEALVEGERGRGAG